MINNRMPEVGKFYRSINAEKNFRVNKIEWNKVYLDGVKTPIQEFEFFWYFEELPNQEQKQEEKAFFLDNKGGLSSIDGKGNITEELKRCEMRDNLSVAKEELRDEIEVTKFTQMTATYINPTWLVNKAQNLLNALDDQNRQEKGVKKCRACGKELLIADCYPFLWNGEEYCDEKCAQVGKKQVEAEKEIKFFDNQKAYFMNENGLQEFPPEDKPKSLWRDVSEKPRLRDYEQVFIKWISGRVKLAEHFKGEFYNIGKAGNSDATYDLAIEFCLPADFINSFEQLQDKVEEMERKGEADLEKLKEAKISIIENWGYGPHRTEHLREAIELIIEVLEGRGR